MRIKRKLCIFGAAIALTLQSVSVFAADAPEFTSVGALYTGLSERTKSSVDWGAADCGEPRWFKNVCVWELGSMFKMVATDTPKTVLVAIDWTISRKQSPQDTRMQASVFERACRSIIASLKPDMDSQQIAKWTSGFIGNGKKDKEATVDENFIQYVTFPESRSCQIFYKKKQ